MKWSCRMYLHKEDRELFKDMIQYVSEKANVREDIIEKDYYVTLLLLELSQIDYPVVFKGGTSLSKAYKVIDRFSEDIDITFTEHLGEARRKKLKYKVMQPISEKLGLTISNWEYIESDKNLNQYIFSYESVVDDVDDKIPSAVIIETSLMSYSFPTNVCEISNYLYEYLKDIQHEVLKECYLLPFKMRVQSLERTLIDKIFAICDYYLLNSAKKNARHLYDIYKLQNFINIDDEFLQLVKEVRMHRLSLGDTIAPAACYDINIKQLALEICESDFYKQDYEATTVFMISDQIEYETVRDNYLNIVQKIWIEE